MTWLPQKTSYLYLSALSRDVGFYFLLERFRKATERLVGEGDLRETM